MQDCIKKITKAERAESTAQVVEHLLSKCKALNSNLEGPPPPKLRKII
jgi:hypothetical protein